MKGSSTHRALQNAIVAAISEPGYSFSLPTLSDWDSVVSSSASEKQRLEFVGDAVMHLSMALYLYHLFPEADPGLYTNIRSAANANATFAHLMVKAGAYEPPSHSHSPKAVADSFEVIVAALYMERGFADTNAWVQEQYAPLIAAARDSYDKCHASPGRTSIKRHGGPLDSVNTPLPKKSKLSSRRSSPQSTLMAQHVINRMKSKGKVKLSFPTKKPNLPRRRSRKPHTPKPKRQPSLVIDLTVSDDDEPASSIARRVSQRRAKERASQNALVLSTSPPILESDQSFGKCTDHHHSEPAFTTLLTLPHRNLEPFSLVSSVTAMSPRFVNSRPGSPLPSQSQLDNVHAPTGMCESPVIVGDGGTEN